jgi:hypothetical protein
MRIILFAMAWLAAMPWLAPMAFPQSAPRPAAIRFESVPGPGFVLAHSPTSQKYLPETMAGGLAAFDYNNDGRPDLFFANGAELPSMRKTGPQFWNRLYRNDGGFHFSDVTERAGLAGEGFAFGAAVADFDGDGNLDLFVPALPASRLYRNRGDGTFVDVTAGAGLLSGPWTIAAGWFDYDRDGRPDLFVVNYLDWSPAHNPWCGDRAHDLRIYCHPNQFGGTSNQLFHNLGNGRFEDVSVRSGISVHKGKGMSVAFADYDGDGYPDIYVTNDSVPNYLFRNRGHGAFEEVALQAGVALPDRGRAVSAMGVDFRDYDNDGLPDILFAALAGETFPLFRNTGGGSFEDATARSRLSAHTARLSGWGVALADFDNDGRKDIFSANSHVNDRAEETSAERYRLSNAVFRNLDGIHFEDVSISSPALAGEVHAHRGCAVADFDGDGRLDVAITALGAPAELWRNVTAPSGHWIDLDIGGNPGGVVRIGTQVNQHSSAAGYSSSSFGAVHFGLGDADRVGLVEVTLPDGRKRTHRELRIDRIERLR